MTQDYEVLVKQVSMPELQMYWYNTDFQPMCNIFAGGI